MTETKMIETGAIASLTTGVMLCDNFSKVHEAAEWVMGHPVWTHQLPALREQMKQAVLKQYPDMPTEVGADGWQSCRDKALKRYGAKVIVKKGDSPPVSPFDHLPEHVRDKTIVIVKEDEA